MASAVTFDFLFEAPLLFSNSGYFEFCFEAFKETISILHEVCRTEQLR